MKHLIPLTLSLLVATSCTKEIAQKKPGYYIEPAYIALSTDSMATLYDNTSLINMQWEPRPDKPTGVYITAYDLDRHDLHLFFTTPADTLAAATTYHIQSFAYEMNQSTARERWMEITIDSIKRNRVFGSITGTATDYRGYQLRVQGTIVNIYLQDHE